MKRFWSSWLAVVASTAMISSATAQNDWNQSNDIGSYQSILSRAGYQNGEAPAQVNGVVPGQMGTPSGEHIFNGQPRSGQAMNGPNMNAQPAMGQPMHVGGCAGDCGGGVNGCTGGVGYAGQQNYGGQIGNGGYTDGYPDGCNDGDVYGRTSGLASRLGGLGSRAGSGSNYVFGAQALFFRRDHEDDVPLTRNGAGQVLRSTSARMGTMGGVSFGLTKRNCNGNGIQFGYWGLYPGQQNSQILGPGLSSYLTGFNSLAVAPGAQNLLNYYNNSDSNRIYRDNEIHSAEGNLLRNGGNYTTRGGRAGNFEMLGGMRWFQFNEDFRYSAFYAAANPSQVDYTINNTNTLLGFQIGGRNQLCLSDRLTLITATKLGAFNNRINSDQSITDSNGNFAYRTALGVDDYNYSSTKNDLALLGELDMGMAYRFSQNARATFGYRVLGINGLALAPSQIPRNFDNGAEISSINSNNSLILGGGYAGLEFCY